MVIRAQLSPAHFWSDTVRANTDAWRSGARVASVCHRHGCRRDGCLGAPRTTAAAASTKGASERWTPWR